MNIEKFTSRGVHVIAVSGEMARAVDRVELSRVCDAALDAGAKALVLDLSAIESIDSAGMGALVHCSKSAAEHGADLRVVVRSGGPVAEALALIGLDRMLEPHEDLASAVGSLPY